MGRPFNKNQQLDSDTSLDLRDISGVNNVAGSNDLIKPDESWSSRFVNFQLTFAAFILFTSAFTFIGVLSAPLLTSQEQVSSKTAEHHAISDFPQINYLPFYSGAAVFTVLNFVVYGTLMGIINCVRYARYGVCN